MTYSIIFDDYLFCKLRFFENSTIDLFMCLTLEMICESDSAENISVCTLVQKQYACNSSFSLFFLFAAWPRANAGRLNFRLTGTHLDLMKCAAGLLNYMVNR